MAEKNKAAGKKLTGKQARYLRGLGHHLTPVVLIGKEGLSDNLMKSVNDTLGPRELIKVKLLESCPIERHEAASALAQKAKAALVQVLGKTILLYRENKELKPDKKISLPGK